MLARDKGWQDKVYHPGGDNSFYTRAEWRALRRKVIRDDNNVCQACGTSEELSVHHILPRKKGGPDEYFNLITLCSKCHDLIEIAISEGEWLYSRSVITGYFEDVIDVDEDMLRATDRAKWHLWVYGGYKRPKG